MKPHVRAGVEHLQSIGFCGEVSPDGERVCILDAGHVERHPWSVELIPFGDVDRDRLRELGTLLDQLDAANASDDDVAVSNLLTSARLTYLGGFCAGLADREPEQA